MACYISVRVFASAVCNGRPPQHRRGQNCGLYQLAVLPARRVHRSTFCSCNTRPDTDRRAAGPCRPGLCAPCETSSARLVSFAWVTRKGPMVSRSFPGIGKERRKSNFFFDRVRYGVFLVANHAYPVRVDGSLNNTIIIHGDYPPLIIVGARYSIYTSKTCICLPILYADKQAQFFKYTTVYCYLK